MSYADMFIQLARCKFYTVQRSLNSINKPLFDNFRVLNLYPKLLIFPLLLNFSIHSDLIPQFIGVSGISFRFPDSVPLIFPNQSLFDEFQGITLNYGFSVW